MIRYIRKPVLFEELLCNLGVARSKVRLPLDLESGNASWNPRGLQLRRALLLGSLVVAAKESGSEPMLVLRLSRW